MSKEKKEKTNAMHILDRAKVSYVHHSWEQATGQHTGVELAKALGENPEQVFKTLVTVGKSGAYYVFLVPVDKELDLKKAADIVGEKAIGMCKAKELLPLTGYVHGGCSPIGMKKLFPTVIHETAKAFAVILFSAEKIGHQLEIAPADFQRIVPFQFGDIVVDSPHTLS
ncbi:MAG: Cys-tRNA(Pro) deacylase [Ruminococcus sp.]|nr:Cys-tRNA(Pro) deacylase [Ruminococcus sp.]